MGCQTRIVSQADEHFAADAAVSEKKQTPKGLVGRQKSCWQVKTINKAMLVTMLQCGLSSAWLALNGLDLAVHLLSREAILLDS